MQEYDLRNTASLEESVRHSDVVYNLVGRDYPTKYGVSEYFEWLVLILFRNFDLEDVHVEGAERIAEAVAKYDIDRFIHVSSYNANKNSPSEFFRTKVSRVELEVVNIAKQWKGSRRRGSTQYFSGDNDCQTSSSVRFRRPLAAQTCWRNESIYFKPYAGEVLACSCT